jgi:fructosamine-3-kinase
VQLSARPGAIYSFEEEHRSLTALSATQTLRVPMPYSFGLLSDGVHSYLAMEEMDSVPFGSAFKTVAGQLGHGTTHIHHRHS